MRSIILGQLCKIPELQSRVDNVPKRFNFVVEADRRDLEPQTALL